MIEPLFCRAVVYKSFTLKGSRWQNFYFERQQMTKPFFEWQQMTDLYFEGQQTTDISRCCESFLFNVSYVSAGSVNIWETSALSTAALWLDKKSDAAPQRTKMEEEAEFNLHQIYSRLLYTHVTIQLWPLKRTHAHTHTHTHTHTLHETVSGPWPLTLFQYPE